MLIIDDLTIQRDGTPLRYSLSINPGERIAIQGESGVGKTTLLHLIAGYETAEAGRLQWQQQNLLALPAEQRPVSILFQDHNLFEHLSARENLYLGFSGPAPKQLLEDAAQQLSVTALLDKKPPQLSGGQRQRIALIRTLLRPEPIVLLDEPFAELDPKTRQQAAHWTREHAIRQGKTLLLVTHQQEDVTLLAERSIQL